MTSVVGILNKRGIALAADSSVTRELNKDEKNRLTKYIKNGNKMVRLSNAVPVTVMFTGNAEFLGIPWDVIVRRYRQKRGDVAHATVEDAMNDFFSFISQNPVFWNQDYANGLMRNLVDVIFKRILANMSNENERSDLEEMVRPTAFKKTFIGNANKLKLQAAGYDKCPQYADYSIESFRRSIEDLVDLFFEDRTIDDNFNYVYERYPKEVIDKIRPVFEDALFAVISSGCLSRYLNANLSAELIFSGFGADQEYPSLIPARVCEGYDFHVNYFYREDDIICISDERPVAICPFAQVDVTKSILRGIHGKWSEYVKERADEVLDPFSGCILSPGDDDMPDALMPILLSVKTDDLQKKFFQDGMKMLNKNQREWERALKDYDLEEMAALADSLIDLTGFHKILTFSQEEVGGMVDLAVISKVDGFTWLRRKNWYYKDNGMSI